MEQLVVLDLDPTYYISMSSQVSILLYFTPTVGFTDMCP